MPLPSSHKPQLLSPAGSLEAFFAALDAGADAVYLGLPQFSARAKAKNIPWEQLPGVLSYAHNRKRQVYITINTLLKDAELSQLIDALAYLEELQVDAIIIQDLGVWRLARHYFPNLRLHASTQMTVHNAAGVKQLQQQGFSRVVLARECTLEQIRAIAAATDLELEVFGHGALCFCFSGQCLFSSWLGGQSGNRGRCAQPCRRRYTAKDKPGYYFSPNDLSTIDLVPQLCQAGIHSLKLEGRMKSADYVRQVVSAYRLVLDQGAEQIPAAKQLLKESLGRVPTKGFIGGGEAPQDIASPKLHGATGQLLGRIDRPQGHRFQLQLQQPLQLGDRVRIQPQNDQSGSAFTVKSLHSGSKRLKHGHAGTTVSLEAPPHIQPRKGDRVFRVAAGGRSAPSPEKLVARLSQEPQAQTPLTLHAEVQPDCLQLKWQLGQLSGEETFAITSHAAEKRPLEQATLEKVFRQCGEHPFTLSGFSCGQLPAVVIPPSELKAIRRRFYQQLEQNWHQQQQGQRRQQQQLAHQALYTPEPPPQEPAKPLWSLRVRNLQDLRSLPAAQQIDCYILPLELAVVEPLTGWRPSGPLTAQRLVLELPPVIFPENQAQWQQAINSLYAHGWQRFQLTNPGHFAFFQQLEQVRLRGGWRLHTLNHQALAAWQEWGLEQATIYPEADYHDLTELLSRPQGAQAELLVYGKLPMMLSRIAIPGLKPGSQLQSERGDVYRVERRQGLTQVLPQHDFSLLGRLESLKQLGARRFCLDLAHVGAQSKAAKGVLSAAFKDQTLQETTDFNISRELM